MTPKQQVLRVCPKAKCHKENDGGMLYIIMDQETDEAIGYWSYFPRRAWEYAWQYICESMMRKFKS